MREIVAVSFVIKNRGIPQIGISLQENDLYSLLLLTDYSISVSNSGENWSEKRINNFLIQTKRYDTSRTEKYNFRKSSVTEFTTNFFLQSFQLYTRLLATHNQHRHFQFLYFGMSSKINLHFNFSVEINSVWNTLLDLRALIKTRNFFFLASGCVVCFSRDEKVSRHDSFKRTQCDTIESKNKPLLNRKKN